MSLKEKTLSGLSWSFVDNIGKSIVGFVIGIVLARLIAPEEFGIIGITTIFLTILPIFSDGGFGSALIQKKDCTEKDYSSVFYFNIAVSVCIYVLIFFSAPYIGTFFEIEVLPLVIQILAINIIFSAFGAVQSVILTKRLNFKLLSKISVSTQLVSGIIAIGLAYMGWGVWALVFRNLLQTLASVLLLYKFNGWYPKRIFDFASLKSLFRFGSNLLVSNLINNLFNNAYYFVIGKFYSPAQLGYYTRADMFQSLPSQNLTAVVKRVSFPVLSGLQDDPVILKAAYKKLVVLTMFISCLLMFGMAAAAESLILTLLGDTWAPSVPYLQLLCFSGFLYPIHALNLNIMNVKGRSDLFLKAEVIKKIMLVPVVMLGIYYQISWMLIGMIVFSFAAYFLNAGMGGPLINYPIKHQIKDVLPLMVFAFAVAVIMYAIAYLLSSWLPIFLLTAQAITGFLAILILGESLKYAPYLALKEIALDRFITPLRAFLAKQ